ncbi:helix-turn-helix transcriptional regulator [Viridibacillus arvi]|uniref:helix-turn-helix transcriptional regulator n=1 Tax=Viridibacillus arvi TaxID=263475 RepID=UPI003D28EE89
MIEQILKDNEFTLSILDNYLIGQNIKVLRKQNSFTQRDLGQKLGVSSQVISNWERGNSLPSLIDAKRLAKLFSCTIDFLINSEEFSNTDIQLSKLEDKNMRRYWYKELIMCKNSDLETLKLLWETLKQAK